MEFIGKLKVVVDYRKIKSRGRLKEKSFRIYWKIKSRGRLKEKSYNSPLIILYLFTVHSAMFCYTTESIESETLQRCLKNSPKIIEKFGMNLNMPLNETHKTT